MKKSILLLSPLFILVGLQAEPTTYTGTTVGHYQKPGAPIDMSYNSPKVDVNETTQITITLNTSVPSGTMSVNLKLDDNLIEETNIQKNLTFNIEPNKRTFHINLNVKSEKEGLYYIRLLCKNNQSTSSRMRAFAVPVYVGEAQKPKSKGILMKAMSGENLSISKAVEIIRTIDD